METHPIRDPSTLLLRKKILIIHHQINAPFGVCLYNVWNKQQKELWEEKPTRKLKAWLGFMKTWNLKIKFNLNLIVISYVALLYIFIYIYIYSYIFIYEYIWTYVYINKNKMKYVLWRINFYIMYILQCHTFTTTPCFHYDAILLTINLFTIHTLSTYLDYNLKVAYLTVNHTYVII